MLGSPHKVRISMKNLLIGAVRLYRGLLGHIIITSIILIPIIFLSQKLTTIMAFTFNFTPFNLAYNIFPYLTIEYGRDQAWLTNV